VETAPQTTIRRLGPGDEAVVEALAEQAEPRTALLRDERTVFLAAFAGERPVGFAFGYVLPRRRGKPASMFVYEIAVEERYRRRGIATDLMRRLLAEAPEAFVLTEPDNEAANVLYASLGGTRSEAAMWEW
jgi:ribosomal protein S18 acetylase RimI-like enzyme